MYTCLAARLVPVIVNWSYMHGVLLSRHHRVYMLGSPTSLDTHLLPTLLAQSLRRLVIYQYTLYGDPF